MNLTSVATRAGRGAALAAAALAAAGLIAACGGSSKSAKATPEGTQVGGNGKKLDVARVARAIELRIEEERHLHSKVRCPAEVEQRQGNTFTCIAEGTEKGRTGRLETYRTPFTVEQLNSKGYVYFHS